MAEVTQWTGGSWSVLNLCVGHRFSPLKWISKMQQFLQWALNRVNVQKPQSPELSASPRFSQASPSVSRMAEWLTARGTLSKMCRHPGPGKSPQRSEISDFLLHLLKENGHCLVTDVDWVYCGDHFTNRHMY